MKVIIFGASGMVGQGVLIECLRDPGVTGVLAVGRSPSGKTHPKLKDLTHRDFLDFTSVATEFVGYDACFYCLGVSSFRMKEADYARVTYDFTLAAARALVAQNPAMTFIYVTGSGTDSTEKGGTMWARVKGKTENALLALPFKAKYLFRPGYIHPMDGVTSKTPLYRAGIAVAALFYPLAKRLVPNQVTSSREVGRAMISLARHGGGTPVVEVAGINAAAARL